MIEGRQVIVSVRCGSELLGDRGGDQGMSGHQFCTQARARRMTQRPTKHSTPKLSASNPIQPILFPTIYSQLFLAFSQQLHSIRDRNPARDRPSHSLARKGFDITGRITHDKNALIRNFVDRAA